MALAPGSLDQRACRTLRKWLVKQIRGSLELRSTEEGQTLEPKSWRLGPRDRASSSYHVALGGGC